VTIEVADEGFGTDQPWISSWDYRIYRKGDLHHPVSHVLSPLIPFDRISAHRFWSYLDTRFTWSIRGYSSSIIDSSIDDLCVGHADSIAADEPSKPDLASNLAYQIPTGPSRQVGFESARTTISM
jgi:hypothetical protein